MHVTVGGLLLQSGNDGDGWTKGWQKSLHDLEKPGATTAVIILSIILQKRSLSLASNQHDETGMDDAGPLSLFLTRTIGSASNFVLVSHLAPISSTSKNGWMKSGSTTPRFASTRSPSLA